MGEYKDYVAKYGSGNKAADALNIPRTTFKERLKKEIDPPQPIVKSGRVNFRSISDGPIRTGPTKIVYFTDAHNQPGMSTDRFRWLAGLINDQKPDVVVDGGDGDDLNSLCSHERDETYKGRLKPLLANDLDCAANMRLILRNAITHDCHKIITLGNHEHRLWTYENENPAMYGIVTNTYTDMLSSYGWEHFMYGHYVNIAGVDFTHVPFNVMGKPVGGDSACKQIADKSLHDTVFGHSHKLDLWNAAKFGDSRSVMAFNGGCFMPDGYVPSYSQNTRKEFWYGAHVLHVAEGRIRSIKSWCMSELESLYGS